jgi:hypothetical protein
MVGGNTGGFNMGGYDFGTNGPYWNGISMLNYGAIIPSGGKHFWLDPANGSDGNTGKSPSKAFQTIYKAFSACTSGHNDVIHLLSDGTTATTARLSLALAVGVDPTATVGTLAWNKNATHLIGECAPSGSRRARIAPVTTQTVTVFNSGNMVSVTGYGCIFANFQAWGGFATGAANEICWTDSGRNFYSGVEILGLADTYSAVTATNGRSLLCNGSVGDSTFYRCQIGQDSFTRTAASPSSNVEFKGGTPRNRFIECDFPMYTTANTTIHLYSAGTNSMDRFQLFDRCRFLNAGTQSGGITATAVATIGAASGGKFVFKDCTLTNFTGFGEGATTRGQILIDGGAPAAATTGLAVAPTA